MACGKPCNCPSYREHLLSVGFGAQAMPTRRADVADVERREVVLRKDLDAYTRLRREGLQPQSHVGAADLESRAVTAAQIEGRP